MCFIPQRERESGFSRLEVVRGLCARVMQTHKFSVDTGHAPCVKTIVDIWLEGLSALFRWERQSSSPTSASLPRRSLQPETSYSKPPPRIRRSSAPRPAHRNPHPPPRTRLGRKNKNKTNGILSTPVSRCVASRFAASQTSNKTSPAGFEHLLMATHYTCLMGRCREKGGKDCLELASKMSITLLRYSDFIPSDKCFYQARTRIHARSMCVSRAFQVERAVVSCCCSFLVHCNAYPFVSQRV